MAHRKRRVHQHIMEDASYQLIKEYLPSEWVVRRYNPDYGINYVVEIFDYIDNERRIAEALGDMFFVQAKSMDKTRIEKVRVYPRFNVEKGPLKEDRSEFRDIEVIKYAVDRDLLLTVESMGAGVPVLLLLVCLDTRRIFYVCLNDMIEKVIIPSEWDYAKRQGKKQILIPVRNEITPDARSHLPLRMFARRMKLYSAFLKFVYQERELHFVESLDDDRSYRDYVRILEYLRKVLHFVNIIKRYDIWQTEWAILRDLYKELVELEQRIATAVFTISNTPRTKVHKIPEVLPDFQYTPPRLVIDIQTFWDRLVNLSEIHEEIWREKYLPTFLGDLLWEVELGEESQPVKKAEER